MNFPNTEIKAPNTIYLAEFEDVVTWCADSAPILGMNPEDEIKYIRADLVENLIKAANKARIVISHKSERKALFDAIEALQS